MMRRTWVLLAFLASFLMAAPLPAAAQDTPPEKEAGEQKADDKKQDEKKPDEKQDPKATAKKDPDVDKYEKAIKDLEKHEGAFTFYVRKKDILLELPESRLDKLFYVQATLNTGFSPILTQAGDPVNMDSVDVFKFVRKEDQVWLTKPNLRFRFDGDDPLAVASERTFPDAIVGDFRIEQKHPEKKLLLINVGNLFFGSLFRLQELVAFGAGGPYALDRDKSGLDKIKAYPENTTVRMAMHFASQGGGPGNAMSSLLALLGLGFGNHLADDRSVPFKVTYNLWYRLESGYRPRLGDTRVGFFTHDYFAVDRFKEFDRTERFIWRYDLKKKDPTAPLSEPVKPIEWVVDPSVPERFRDAVKRGVLLWNAAFEQAGFKNAIVVRDAPKDDPDYDHADGRYNVIRWTMSEELPYAVAWARTDPISGQVLNASVTVDANFPVVIMQDFQVDVTGALPKGRESAMAHLLHGGDTQAGFSLLDEASDAKRSALDHLATRFGWKVDRCTYARSAAERATMGLFMLRAKGAPLNEDEYANSFVTDLIAHEVGHCLGLRHNFAGSTNLTASQLLDDRLVQQAGIAASVMDYTPANIMAILRGGGVFFNPVVGIYDRWAIEYGYKPIIAGSPQGERYMLDEVAKRSGLPGHLYLTDEDADGINPLAVRNDLSADPIAWLSSSLEGNRRVRDYALHRFTKVGEDYAMRNNLLFRSLILTFRDTAYAARFVGGVEARRNFKGDLGEKPTLKPVDAKLQREAMRTIVRETLSMSSLPLPASVLHSLHVDPNSGSGSTWNAPMRRIVSQLQIEMLATLMSARKADQIAENEFKTSNAKDKYTLTEHYNTLFSGVFTEIGKDVSITPLRRDLQRFMIDGLITQASARPGGINDDVRVIASQGLIRLHKRVKDQVARPAKLDEMTRLHLADVADQIRRYQERQVVGSR